MSTHQLVKLNLFYKLIYKYVYLLPQNQQWTQNSQKTNCRKVAFRLMQTLFVLTLGKAATW